MLDLDDGAETLAAARRPMTLSRITQSKGASVTTMIVLVSLKEGVNPEEYERWILESYAPAVRSLPPVEDWRDYRVGGLLGSDADPPYHYVVTLEVRDMEQLGRAMQDEIMQRHLSELRGLAEVTQITAERFA